MFIGVYLTFIELAYPSNLSIKQNILVNIEFGSLCPNS